MERFNRNHFQPGDQLGRVMEILGQQPIDALGGGKSPLLDLAETPLDALILTILSQATSDRNSARAFLSLKETFPRWEELLDAPVSQIERAIASGGLAARKAPRIQEVLRNIMADHGRPSLDDLNDWSSAKIAGYLMAMPGVGPKTAACVLFFGFNRPAFPVDTHVHRVTSRLGLVPRDWPAPRVQDYLEQTIPPEKQGITHIQLIDLGRTVCRPSRPRCEGCPFAAICPANSPEQP